VSETARLRLAGLRSAIEATLSAETGRLRPALDGRGVNRHRGGGQSWPSSRCAMRPPKEWPMTTEGREPADDPGVVIDHVVDALTRHVAGSRRLSATVSRSPGQPGAVGT